MLEIDSRSRTETELTNRIDQVAELFKLVNSLISSIIDIRLNRRNQMNLQIYFLNSGQTRVV